MQTKEHKECVAELRRRCEDQKNKLHVIRDGEVISLDKEKGSAAGIGRTANLFHFMWMLAEVKFSIVIK